MLIDNIILSQLIYNEEYVRRVLPFIKDEYFSDNSQKTLFTLMGDYIKKYNGPPSKEALQIELDNQNMADGLYKSANQLLENLEKQELDIEWLIDNTEKFCQDKALFNAISQSIKLIDEKDKGNISKGAIPTILQEALAVSFTTNIGHDYIEDSDDRFMFYHRKEDRIPFDLDMMNTITGGGLIPKTLNVILAGTGVGKTMFMTHCAAANLMDGKNVLYITMEMAEERIAERIDANLLNTKLDDLIKLNAEEYAAKVEKVKARTVGKLIIKEYPTGSANASHFRYLLNELKLKKNFTPDIIFIDYLNICSSSRVKSGGSTSSYSLIKSIAEELRGLAVEFKLPIITATQTNRAGFSDSDIGLEATSDSFGLPMTADLMFALITSEELEELNQICVKQLKNRYTDVTKNKRFNIGVERAKMRFYDVEQSAQDFGEANSSPVFDRGSMSSTFKDFFNKN